MLTIQLILPVPSLLKRWKRLEAGMDLSAETFGALSKRFKEHSRQWLKAENHAQSNRHKDHSLMDIYDTVTAKGMKTSCIRSALCQ
jgi:hypothetical protein